MSASFLTFTLPILLIGVAAVIAAVLVAYWHRQDAPYEEEPTPWEREMERRRLQRERAEARHRKAA